MYPIAQYETHENAIPFLTAVGSFTTTGHCFATATSAKRICVFDTSQPPDSAKTYIKIGQKITCLLPCKYRDHEAIVIGADNSVQLFDVDQNTQIFTSLISDGASALCVIENQTIYVGSNCSILGYDFSGQEVFWTVTGDIVSAMCEIVWDNQKCLLAASNDQMIRLFNGEEAIQERKVHSNVSFLAALGPNKYAIAFQSGSVALIDGVQKVWDIAAPGQVVGMQMLDYAGGGKRDIAIATAEGTLAILDVTNGHIARSDDIGLKISGLHLLDFKNDNHMCLVVIGNSGSVRIFLPNRTEGLGAEAKHEFDLRQAQPTLIKEKARLLLREYELTRDMQAVIQSSGKGGLGLPKMPNLKWSLGQRLDLGCAELRLFTDPPTPIQASVIECQTTSGGEFTVFEVNNPPTPEQQILLNIPDNATCDMRVDSFVQGVCISFECKHQKFFGFQLVTDAEAEGYAEFPANEKFSSFVSKSFVVKGPLGPKFKCCFQSLETQDSLIVSSDGKNCRVECDSIDTAVRIINEYCDSCDFPEFECRAHFPKDFEALMKAVREGSELDDTKVVQKAEIAGLIASLKDMIVRIENAEDIGQYQTLLESVVECERLNAEIAREHVKRITNKDTLGFGNQKVNSLIQKFAELRKGNARNSLLQMCRKELQSHDYKKLSYLLEFGHHMRPEDQF
ncbi:hypothetical protein TRFO_21618 [Tritrichomonas foetus]|uniref:Bardet-Biedl syndrome 2 protein homolog n=1 Tax=Tritrichomonas foetus TaxID=1144522 RepID=A0A1J4KDX8_9EUKA|nr:hypothetical protein TRFO_21618 [Tritrichomonas foetus]|eukprot:OHT09403.1 hypothetical protein TRFO_21618 [Tritrichomonas foetus]